MSKIDVTTRGDGSVQLKTLPAPGIEVYGFMNKGDVWLVFDTCNFQPRITWCFPAEVARDIAAAILAVMQERAARQAPVATEGGRIGCVEGGAAAGTP